MTHPRALGLVFVMVFLVTAACPHAALGQDQGAAFFFSWGYNGDVYTRSDLQFDQPGLGSTFTLYDVHASDKKGWTGTSLFQHALTIPQYNVRVGYFFNTRWGVEMAMDHIKWVVDQGQSVRLAGTVAGVPTDTTMTLTPDVLRYQLNNGANPVFVNVIRRVRLRGSPGRTGGVSLLLKGGGGFAVPHTENSVFGQPNQRGFQWFHGWDLDADAAIRVNLFKGVYAEFEEKALYVRYWGLNINEGTARQSVKGNEMILNVGIEISR